MNNISIEVQNISKEYNLGLISSGSLARDITSYWYRFFNKKDPNINIINENNLTSHKTTGIIKALKNINFKISQGEIVGIIGKNGAGKSTLLKILSRITVPSNGKVKIIGRLSSLLEVGTGFHPELTGKENIYLNGSIMGMRKREIDENIDNIIDFSGVRKFIDTPVKRYSTGMRVRLGFSVAAHLNPEILLIDEVLAVGDAEFQKKCLGKIKNISSYGRTVLFVSHNLSAIKSICERTLLLDKGELVYDGETNKTLRFYKNNILKPFSTSIDYNMTQNDITLKNIGVSKKEIISGEAFTLFFKFKKNDNVPSMINVTFHLTDEYGTLIFVGGSAKDKRYSKINILNSDMDISCTIPKDLMNEGLYSIHRLLFVKDKGTILFEINDCFSFSILPKKQELGWIGDREEGLVDPKLEWEITSKDI